MVNEETMKMINGGLMYGTLLAVSSAVVAAVIGVSLLAKQVAIDSYKSSIKQVQIESVDLNGDSYKDLVMKIESGVLGSEKLIYMGKEDGTYVPFAVYEKEIIEQAKVQMNDLEKKVLNEKK